MLISRDKKYIYVDVPKTGSSSIHQVLKGCHGSHLNIAQAKQMFCSTPDRYSLKSRALRYLYKHSSKSFDERMEEKFKEYFVFGFVRNPWDRVVSLYMRKEGIVLREKMSFEEFVDWIQFSSATCIFPLPHKYQLDWFRGNNGEILADFIGRFENLEEDWKYVANKIGVCDTLPQKNSNPHKPKKHYSTYYTPKTKQIIEEKFKEDIEYFGYSFEG